jgi:monovalent cation/proton antiporter MnhG/PhaG subunit
VIGVLVWILLGVGVLTMLAGVLGLLIAADVYDRLHFIGPGSLIAPPAFALAVVLDEGPLSQAGLKSTVTALELVGLGPVLVHATARAAYVRERGELTIEEPVP